MGNSYSSCSVLEIFLGVLTGLVWLLLSFFGVISTALGLTGGIATTINIVVAIVGVLAVILFSICIFKRVWHCCWGGRC